MTRVSIIKNISWVPSPNTVETFLSDTIPDGVASTAFVLAFDGDKLLMAETINRGIEMPGGHVDDGETPEAAMRREALEETGAVIGKARLIAYQKVTVLADKPEGYKYPYPESYQLIYFSNDFTQGVFTSDEDSKGPVLVSPVDAVNLPWIQKNREIYDHALSLARGDAPKPKKNLSL